MEATGQMRLLPNLHARNDLLKWFERLYTNLQQVPDAPVIRDFPVHTALEAWLKSKLTHEAVPDIYRQLISKVDTDASREKTTATISLSRKGKATMAVLIKEPEILPG